MTVTAPGVPAVSLVGKPAIVRVFTVAASTLIPDSVALKPGDSVSLAVIDCDPDVSSVTVKLCLPASATVKV